MRKIVMGALALLLAARALAMPFDDRITLPSGRRIFVAGFNLAWINYSGDVGDAPLNESLFRRAFKSVAGAGGNAMRVWLSTNGSRDPKFGPDGFVSGLGSKTIDNVRKMLDIARENGLLLIPVLLTHNYMQANQGADLARNRKMLTTKEGLKAYIDKALVPLVTAMRLVKRMMSDWVMRWLVHPPRSAMPSGSFAISQQRRAGSFPMAVTRGTRALSI
jgi:hypothetical protein